MNPILPVGAAGLAYLALHDSGPVRPPSQAQIPVLSVGAALPLASRAALARSGKAGVGNGAPARPGVGGSFGRSILTSGPDAEAIARQAVNSVRDEARRQYNNLTDVAKARGAQTLNGAMKPSPQLTGRESFEEAAQKIGAAAGAAAGSAACTAIPIPGVNVIAAGTVCASLGGIIGGYLGGNVGTWVKDAYAKVGAWADHQLDRATDAIADAASDAASTVRGAVASAYSSVVNIF